MTPKTRILMIAFITLLFMAIVPASAQSITMANPGGIAERDIAVYFSNGSMYGYYNASSVISIDPNESYIFTMKPVSSNFLEDPTDWVTNSLFPFLRTNATILFFSACLIGWVYMRR